FQDAPLPLHTPQGWLRSTNGELLMGQTGLINIIVSSQKFTLTTMVDRNRCVNVKASIAGCYNCEQGATVEMSCKTDYGEALAHVECGSFHFAIHCMHEVRTQRIQVLAKTAEIDEQCQLRCPAGSSSFNLRGLLYQPAATDPWSIAPHASKSTSWFGQAARSL
uniref:VWFD domain-containing protein n=1 Tax=Panagrellus redivivus TaxID=6233 RepID=A0A7E4W2P2_PANRE